MASIYSTIPGTATSATLWEGSALATLRVTTRRYGRISVQVDGEGCVRVRNDIAGADVEWTVWHSLPESTLRRIRREARAMMTETAPRSDAYTHPSYSPLHTSR